MSCKKSTNENIMVVEPTPQRGQEAISAAVKLLGDFPELGLL